MLLEWITEDNFVSYRSGKLDVYRLHEDPYTNKRELQIIYGDSKRKEGGWKDLPGLTCMAFNRGSVQTSQNAIHHALAVGTNVGSVSLIDVINDVSTNDRTQVDTIRDDILLCPPSKSGRRACTGVAWHPTDPSLLAATFEKLRSDYSTVVWDVTSRTNFESTMSCPEVTKCSMDEAATTLAWCSFDSSSLLVGTVKGLLKLYDLRTFTKLSNEAMTIPASNKKIKGIRCNPFNSHVIATFSETDVEPVKIWDLRKNGDAKSRMEPISSIQITGSPFDDGVLDDSNTRERKSSRTESMNAGNIVDVQWCTQRENYISAVTTTCKKLQIYSVNDDRKLNAGPLYSISIPDQAFSTTNISKKSTFSSASTSNTIQAFCWQAANKDSHTNIRAPRVLLGTDEG